MALGGPRVLVIRGGAIGDFILTLPAIKLLRENIPHAHIEILGYLPIVDLAIQAGFADATRSLEHGSMAKLFVPGAKLDESLVGYLKSFTLIVSYLYDPDGYLRGNMEALGVKTYLEASHRVLPGAGHATGQLARPLERLAMYLDDKASDFSIVSKQGAGQKTARPIVAVHPGSGSVKKSWPLDRWIEIGREIVNANPHVQLALVTGEAEHERGITEQMLKGWSQLRALHWDQLALSDLASQLVDCTAFLGHDSGISHLAAACGLPAFLLFGPTDPETWAPLQAGVEVHATPAGDLTNLTVEEMWPKIRSFVARSLDKRSVSLL